MMKKGFKYLLLVVSVGMTFSGCGLSNGNSIPAYTQAASKVVAEDWVRHNSPTYVFDGSNLQFMQSTSLKCQYTWMYEFKFSSASSGYGNRKGKAPDGEKTNHIIQVVVQKDKVVLAASDDQYDELKSKLGEIIGIDQLERTCQQ